MDNSLLVQIDQTFQHLRDINSDQIFWKLPKSLAYIVQRSVLAISREIMISLYRWGTKAVRLRTQG